MHFKRYHLPKAEKTAILEAVATHLRAREELQFAYAYGSFLEEGPFRDLDVALFIDPRALPDSRFRYEDRLAGVLVHALNLPFPFDLKIMNGTPIAFQYHVFQGQLLMERDIDRRLQVVSHVVARYLDMKPILHHYVKEAFAVED